MYEVGGSGLDEMEAFLQKKIGRYPLLIWAGACVPMMGWGWEGGGVQDGVCASLSGEQRESCREWKELKGGMGSTCSPEVCRSEKPLLTCMCGHRRHARTPGS